MSIDQQFPTPWVVDTSGGSIGVYCDDVVGTRIAHLGPFEFTLIPTTEKQREALGALFSAAPDLLEACEAIANGMEKSGGPVPYFLTDAIKKAKGVKS